jgi:hypothetical protein
VREVAVAIVARGNLQAAGTPNNSDSLKASRAAIGPHNVTSSGLNYRQIGTPVPVEIREGERQVWPS